MKCKYVGWLTPILLLSTGFGYAQTSTVAPGDSLQEIVVTSEKISQSLQKTPAAITAVDSAALRDRGIEDARGLEAALPSIEIRPEGAVSQTFMRGIGNNIDIPYSDAAVAYNVNGINLPRYATSSAFFDLERIEALPGPQGTLYGGSAAGGVVNISTQAPSPNFDGEASLEGGNYGLFHGFLAQNFRVAEDLSVRAAIDYERHDGYESNGFDTDKKISGRVSMLWKPSDDFKLLLWGSAFHDGGVPPATVNSPLLDPSHPWNVVSVGPLAGNPVLASLADKDYNTYIAGGRLDWSFNGLTLTYIPGFVYVQDTNSFFAAYFPLLAPDLEHQYTQELRLSNNDGDWRWVGGLYSAVDQIHFAETFAGFPVLTIDQQRNLSYAGFGQVTYSASDRLRLTAGARYSWDGKSADGAGSEGPFEVDRHWTHFDWKVGVDYDLTSRSMLYAAVQTGYLPGGYSPLPNTPTFDNAVKPETLTGETVGIKNRFWDNRLEINNEIYRYDYRNYQVVAISLVTGVTSLFNAGKSLVYGDQLDIKFLVTRADTLSLNIGEMSAYYKNFTLPGGISFAGYQMVDAPSTTIAAGFQHRFDLRDGSNLTFGVQSQYVSGYWGEYDHVDGTRTGPYTRTDVNLTYHSPSDAWTVSVWGKNLENAVVFGAAAAGGQPGPSSNFIDPPRTFGANVGLKW